MGDPIGEIRWGLVDEEEEPRTGGDGLGRRTNYGFEKRQKELKRQQKKEKKLEAKRLKKEKAAGDPEADSGEADAPEADDGESPEDRP